MKDQVDVLLATYQGEAYIKEQVESILNQTYPSIHIWIRDDASKDSTPTILNQLASSYPTQITLIPSTGNLGVRGNFSELMSASKAPYIMFSDQDDVWLPHKVESSLACMKQMEIQYRTDIPLLVHTDLQVVHSDLKQISPSFWNFTRLNPKITALNRLLTQNNVTGCTMLFNQSLLQMSQPIPDQAIMHDWWIALVASAFGYIDHIPSATLLYRQHTSNDVGAKKYGLASYMKEQFFSDKRKHPTRTHVQAQLFLDRFDKQLRSQEKMIVEAYCSLTRLPYVQRKVAMMKHGFLKSGFLRNLHHLFLTN